MVRWAQDDAYVLPAAALNAVEQILQQYDVKTRLLAMYLVRRRLDTFAKVAEQIKDVETLLFDKARLEHMDSDQKIRLLNFLDKRHARADRAADRVLNPDRPNITVKDLQFIVNESEQQKVDLAEEPNKRVIAAIGQLAALVAHKQNRIVSPPPA